MAVTLTGALAGLLLVAAELTTVASVDVARGSCELINDANLDLADRCELSGIERHGGGFGLLGLLAMAMGVVAGVGRARPAALALVAIAAVALFWSFAVDLPEANETGAIGRNFEGASGEPGIGLWLALVGGALAGLAGALRLSRPAG